MPTALSRLGDEMTEGFLEITSFAESLKNADFSVSEGRSTVDFNTPLVLYLASQQRRHTHGVFSANSGR